MIYANHEVIESECLQRITRRRNQFRFDDHRSGAEHIDVALIELAEATARGTIGAPDGLDLITLEKFWQLRFVLRDHARQRHSEIVAQSEIGFARLFMFAALENFEDELITFFAILAHQGLDVFDGRSLQRLETIALVHFLYHTNDVFAFADFCGQEIAHAARWLSLC